MAESRDSKIDTHPWVKAHVLGEGGFGVVTLWENSETNAQIAIKRCKWLPEHNLLNADHVKRWVKEIEIMNKLKHDAVVKCFPMPPELSQLNSGVPMLCMEYCSGGELRKVLDQPGSCCGLREYQVRSCLKDMCEAIGYLHSRRIIHRDLKPENIVLQILDEQVRYKLIDLGYAKQLDQNSACTSFVGTMEYLAPELCTHKEYTCTVDYWSLALVAHEIITGIRPFLPNMKRTDWMMKIVTKKPEHICAYEDRNGVVQFSSHMFPEVHISAPLKRRIEEWLKIMLEWDPSVRGRVESADGKTEIAAFTMMTECLTKKIVKVFVVEKYQLYEYEVTEATSMKELQEWLATDTGISIEDQRPLLPRGQSPDPNRPASQCWAPPDAEEWLLYVFSDKVARPEYAPHFPPATDEMLRHSKKTFDYQVQKKMYAHSIFFLQRESRLLTLLADAPKVFMLHLMSGHNQLTKGGQRMQADIAKLKAHHNFFMDALNLDLSSYEELNEMGKLASPKRYNQWRGTGEIALTKVNAIVDRATTMESSVSSLKSKVLQLQCSPFVRKKNSESLDAIIKLAEKLYTALRRKKKDPDSERKVTDMVKCMCQALHKRDRIHQDLYKQLEQQCECLNKANNLSKPLEQILLDIARISREISQFQESRQKDLWQIIEITTSRVFTGDERPVPPPKVSRAPPPTATSKTLSSLLESSSQQTDSIIAENRDLRCRLIDLLSNQVDTTMEVRVKPKQATTSPTGAIPKVRSPKGVETSL